jgi:hypothetical protein
VKGGSHIWNLGSIVLDKEFYGKVRDACAGLEFLLVAL